MRNYRVALVHDYLIEFGGAERTLEAIHSIFPYSTVFTSFYDKEAMPASFGDWQIKNILPDSLPFFKKLSKQYTFLFPLFFEALDLRDFDIVISTWSAWSKAVITSPKQLHISYCHTPPRFLYKYTGESEKRNTWYYKPFVAYLDSFLRVWDYYSSKRPNFMIANSQNVMHRVQKFYGITPEIIYPPVKSTIELILPSASARFDKDYYLIVSRLVPYKNIDVVILAFSNLGLPLRIVGSGKDEQRLKKLAKGNIAFMGHIDERDLSLMYQNCKGVVFPVKDEDFGITPLEALSHGKPVLAHKSGGVLETLEDGKTGMFFEDLSVEGVIAAVRKFESAIYANQFDATAIKATAVRFDEHVFKDKFLSFVKSKCETFFE